MRDAKGKLLGKIKLLPGRPAEFLEDPEPSFARFVEVCLREGINDIREIYDEKTRSYTSMEVEVGRDDPLFAVAFRGFLERAGFEVAERHEQTESQIRELLHAFDDNNEDKKDILGRLPKMSYREQTFILKKLRELSQK